MSRTDTRPQKAQIHSYCSTQRKRGLMKIRMHSESHIVGLDDGSFWQIYPADLALTIHWEPDVDLQPIRIDGELSSHALISSNDDSRVRVRPLEEGWPIMETKRALRDG
jgi:hypothetical protein